MEHIKEVIEKILENIKQPLSFEEGCKYCGISSSSMYKHTSNNNIPFYKPEGKLIYFKREELDEWMLRNRQSTKEEQESKANSMSFNNRKNRFNF